jgi:LPS sulfotransferase NodH
LEGSSDLDMEARRERVSGRRSITSQNIDLQLQAIDYLVRQIVAQEAAWQHYFSSNGIQQYTIVYEEFASSYEETALSILQYLNIPLPQSLVFAQRRMKQQSDTLSEEWVQRYHQIKQEQTAA